MPSALISPERTTSLPVYVNAIFHTLVFPPKNLRIECTEKLSDDPDEGSSVFPDMNSRSQSSYGRIGVPHLTSNGDPTITETPARIEQNPYLSSKRIVSLDFPVNAKYTVFQYRPSCYIVLNDLESRRLRAMVAKVPDLSRLRLTFVRIRQHMDTGRRIWLWLLVKLGNGKILLDQELHFRSIA